jgi:sugar-phosphatase
MNFIQRKGNLTSIQDKVEREIIFSGFPTSTFAYFRSMKTPLVIFDMDGVLIDSEPWWNVALRNGFRLVDLEMSDEMCEETMGARLNEVIEYRIRKHAIDPGLAGMLEEKILDEIIHLVNTKATILPGVIETINMLKEEGYSLAIASSSPHRLINAVLDKIHCREHFDGIFSAQDDKLGKPNPAVYIRCAESIGFDPSQCVVIEDSVNGMIAAKAAKMRVIVVPDPKMYHDPSWALANLKVRSLLDFKSDFLT